MVAIRVWNKCNNNCIMCSNYFVRNLEENERDFRSMLSRIKEKEPNPKEITFTGGEPFLNPGIFDLIDRFRKMYPQSEINILSNGRLFYYKRYCLKLKKHFDSEMMIAISILGQNSQIHDSITLTEGNFKQTVAGIKNLLALGIKIELRVIVLKQNFKCLKDIAKFISKNLRNVDYVVFIFVDLVSKALKNKDKVAVTYTETTPYLIEAMNVLDKGRIPFRLYHFPFCVLPDKFWSKSWKSVESNKIKRIAECISCPYSEKCAGILKGYYSVFGKKEFKKPKIKGGKI